MSQSPRWHPMWQKKEWKEWTGKGYKERERAKRVFDGGRDVWDVFHRNTRPSVKEMIKMSKSWKSGENKRRERQEMFSKKPETVLAERKGRHFPGGARHSPGCSEICFDLAANSLMFWCLMVWWKGRRIWLFWRWGRCRDLLVRNTQVSQSWQQQQKDKPAEDNISWSYVPSDFLGRTDLVIATRCSASHSPPLVSNMQRAHNVFKIARMANANSSRVELFRC